MSVPLTGITVEGVDMYPVASLLVRDGVFFVFYYLMDMRYDSGDFHLQPPRFRVVYMVL